MFAPALTSGREAEATCINIVYVYKRLVKKLNRG